MEDLTYKDLIIAMGIKGIDYPECVIEYMKRGVTVFERVRSSMYSRRIVDTLGIPARSAYHRSTVMAQRTSTNS